MPKRPASPHSHGRSEATSRPELVAAVGAAKKRLGARLRELRANAELTQEEAAEQAGIHDKYLSKVEVGTANPSLGVLVALASAYKVELRELF